jgi:hypothetical protein
LPENLSEEHLPFAYRSESRRFGEALLKIAVDAQKEQLSAYISRENIQSFHHGRGWLTIREEGAEESTLDKHGIELEINYESIVSNDVQRLFDFVGSFVNGFTQQMVEKMFSIVSDACDKSGNVVKGSDHASNAEAFLAILKKVEFSVNENGQVEMPQLHMPPGEAKKWLDELNAQGPEFVEEVEKIKREKALAAIEKEKARLSKYKSIGR